MSRRTKSKPVGPARARRLTPNEAPWMPPLEYECTEGHVIAPAGGKPLDRCPAYNKGAPCKGRLVRVGKGSRKAAA